MKLKLPDMRSSEGARTALMGAIFVFACAAGTAAAFSADERTRQSAAGMVSLLVFDGDGGTRLTAALFNAFKYQLPTVLFGLGLAGVVTSPAAAALKGFALSYTVSAFTLAEGRAGALAALAVLGPQNLILVPVTVLTAADSLGIALRVATRDRSVRAISGGQAARLTVFALLSLTAAFIEAFLTPTLYQLIK